MIRPQTPYRLSMFVDVEGYSKRSVPGQLDVQDRLLRVVQFACERARIRRLDRDNVQDHGDGQLAVLPEDTDLGQVLPRLILGLRHGLYEANAEPGAAGRIRLRAAFAGGSTGRGATGFVGQAVILAGDLVGSQVFKDVFAAPRNAAADLIVIVDDFLYRDVITSHRYDGVPADGFHAQPVVARANGAGAPPSKVQVWYHLPASGPAPDRRAARAVWRGVRAPLTLVGLSKVATRVREKLGVGTGGLPVDAVGDALDWLRDDQHDLGDLVALGAAIDLSALGHGGRHHHDDRTDEMTPGPAPDPATGHGGSFSSGYHDAFAGPTDDDSDDSTGP